MSGRAVAALITLILLAPVPGLAAEPLRVCLDPNNPPFSMASSARKGIYYEVAELFAERLERPLAVVWWPTDLGKRAIRLQLLGGQCDVMLGVPFVKGLMGPHLLVAGPLLELGYALATRSPEIIETPAALRGRTVAVVFNTPAQNALATLDGVENLVFRQPEQAVEALLARRAEIAFVWDAVAAWFDQEREDVDLRLVRVDGPQMRWQSAAGVARENRELRDRLQQLISELRPQIDAIAVRYGLRHDHAIDWLWTETPPAGGKRGAKEQSGRSYALSAPRRLQPQLDVWSLRGHLVRVAAQGPTALAEGRRLFEAVLGCAHCHGPGAVGPDRARDLRLMRKRYGDRWVEVFWQAVMEGRTETESGLVMPSFQDSASRAELESIRLWLDSLQVWP